MYYSHARTVYVIQIFYRGRIAAITEKQRFE